MEDSWEIRQRAPLQKWQVSVVTSDDFQTSTTTVSIVILECHISDIILRIIIIIYKMIIIMIMIIILSTDLSITIIIITLRPTRVPQRISTICLSYSRLNISNA